MQYRDEVRENRTERVADPRADSRDGRDRRCPRPRDLPECFARAGGHRIADRRSLRDVDPSPDSHPDAASHRDTDSVADSYANGAALYAVTRDTGADPCTDRAAIYSTAVHASPRDTDARAFDYPAACQSRTACDPAPDADAATRRPAHSAFASQFGDEELRERGVRHGCIARY